MPSMMFANAGPPMVPGCQAMMTASTSFSIFPIVIGLPAKITRRIGFPVAASA